MAQPFGNEASWRLICAALVASMVGCSSPSADGDAGPSPDLVGADLGGSDGAGPSLLAVVVREGEDWSLPEDTPRVPFGGLFRMGGDSLPVFDDASLEEVFDCYGVTFTWAELEPAPGTLVLDGLLGVLDLARFRGKCVVSRLKHHVTDRQSPWGDDGVPYVPQWVLDECQPARFYTDQDGDHFIEVAAPWDDCLNDRFLAFVDAFGAADVLADEALGGLYVHGLSSSFGEELWLASEVVADAEAAGMTAENLYSTYASRLNRWASVAGAHVGKLAFVGAGWISGYRETMDALDALAAELGLGLRSGGFENYHSPLESAVRGRDDWGLAFDAESHRVTRLADWPHRAPGRYLGGEDENFEVGPRWDLWFRATVFSEVLVGANFLWLPHDEEFLAPQAELLGWFRQTSTATTAERPDAVIWLREDYVSRPEDDVCSVIRNLELGLIQTNAASTPPTDRFERGDLPGGRFGRDCGDDHFDYFARRTDLAAGVDRFAFAVSDDFAQEPAGSASIKLTWLDESATSWRLVAPRGGSEEVHSEGAGGVRSATISLDSTLLIDATGSRSFEVVVTGPGDLSLRFVRLIP